MDDTYATARRETPGAAGASRRVRHDRSRGRSGSNDRREARTQEAAKQWIREHQDVAMLAAFAFGVFVGVWMRG